MQSHRNAIVVGAGLGGIAAAAHLAHHGYQVTVLEKNAKPGGRCGQLLHDSHRFDTGPTLFLIPQIFSDTYTALGQNIHDHLDLVRIDPTYQFHFEDNSQFELTADLKQMQSQLENIEPGSFGNMLRYIVEGQRHFDLAVQRFASRNYYNPFQYFSPRNLLLVFELKGLVNHYRNVSKYFQHPNLRSAFTFQDMYLGLSPFDAPATYSLLQYTELVDGVWFPRGGMYTIVKSLAALAEYYGAQFLFNSPVKQIVVDRDQAGGVLLEDGTSIAADLIIANADLPYAYNKLLRDTHTSRRLKRKQYTCSAIMFYWGVDKTYPQLKTHNLFVAGDYETSFMKVFNEYSLPDEPNFYVHAPTRVDVNAAPAGQDTLMVLVPVSRLKDGINQDWEAMKSMARSAVLKRLAGLGLSDLQQHIKFELCYTPENWHNMYNIAKGAAFGSLNHNFSQVGYLRPHNRHRRIKNLYFSGGSTHPGNGLPLVLLSAHLTTERILKEYGSPQHEPVFFFPTARVTKEAVKVE